MADNAATETPPADEGAIPLWIRLLLLITSWITPILLHFSPTVREIYDEGLQDFRHHYHHSLAPSSPSTFHNFSALPAELRLRIWSAALPPPRLLPLQLPPTATAPSTPLAYLRSILTPPPSLPSSSSSSSGSSGSNNNNNNNNTTTTTTKNQATPPPQIFTSPTPPPTLLAVNTESRAEARRHYRLGLAPDGYPYPRVYVDLERDVVAVSDEVLASHAGRNLLRLTGDWGRVGRVCVPGGGVAEGVVIGTAGEGMGMERGGTGGRGVFVVNGLVPAWAGSDFWGWARWMEGRGRGRWVISRHDGEEGSDGGYEGDVE
jgi:hypothetical protein